MKTGSAVSLVHGAERIRRISLERFGIYLRGCAHTCFEVSLLNAAAIEQLLSCGTYEQCPQFLSEKAGDAGGAADMVSMLKREEENMGSDRRCGAGYACV